MSEACCGNCRHWKLWPPPPRSMNSIRLCLAPLPEWVVAAGGDQAMTPTQGTHCEAWEAKQ